MNDNNRIFLVSDYLHQRNMILPELLASIGATVNHIPSEIYINRHHLYDVYNLDDKKEVTPISGEEAHSLFSLVKKGSGQAFVSTLQERVTPKVLKELLNKKALVGLESHTIYIRRNIEHKFKVLPLKEFINLAYNGSLVNFAKSYGLYPQHVSRWLSYGEKVIWARNNVYIKKTNFSSDMCPVEQNNEFAIFFSDYIEQEFDSTGGVLSGLGLKLFAKSRKIAVSQAYRYLRYNGLWYKGQIYKQQTNF
jgi:hypothetical protein